MHDEKLAGISFGRVSDMSVASSQCSRNFSYLFFFHFFFQNAKEELRTRILEHADTCIVACGRGCSSSMRRRRKLMLYCSVVAVGRYIGACRHMYSSMRTRMQ
jgi:hypothetical protein